MIEVAVVAVPDELAGSRLHAVLRREPDSKLNSLTLRKHCAERLARTEMPSTIEIVTEPLPKTSTGKIDRKLVLARLEEGLTRMDETTAKIKQFIVDEFMPDVSVDELDSDFDLLTGGVVDSLGLLQVVAWLETEFDVGVDDSELGPESFRTVDAIKDVRR